MNEFEVYEDDFDFSNSSHYDDYYEELDLIYEFEFEEFTPPPSYSPPIVALPIIYEDEEVDSTPPPIPPLSDNPFPFLPNQEFSYTPPPSETLPPPISEPLIYETEEDNFSVVEETITAPPESPLIYENEKVDPTFAPVKYEDIGRNSSNSIINGGNNHDDDMQSAEYGILALQIVAMTLSVVVIIGLLIPLLKQLKNGNFYQKRNSRRSEREAPYSTYNLYLVYAALADLSCMATIISNLIFGTTTTIMVNLWINGVIVYEVLALLQASKSARRINQPSLTKVNLQAGGIVVGAVLLAVLQMYTTKVVFRSVWYSLYFMTVLYVIGVTIFVKCKALLPPSNGTTPRDKAVRGLALFFFRVILVFLVIWIPGLILGMVNISVEGSFRVWYDCLTALQPIVNFYLILSKPDVKKYITDLLTLTYVFGDTNKCSCNRTNSQKDDSVPSANANQENSSRRTRTTILGFSFENATDDNHANEDDNSAIGSNSDGGEADKNKSPMIESANDGNNQDVEAGSGVDLP